ncbi:uncharacterized protein LOC119611666 [Lucilia sericata]|uniref:uncharacterized protein LOC119611666 n=1 Tax=Lucilia sericata TaxID=13632 RepID=UPI0018A87211|nr:uncharacterized protein LOC119611666 [Lucilia sericata]XP_037823251.1 uncharacterized protein LOC119611666 [Lucilia sericata]
MPKRQPKNIKSSNNRRRRQQHIKLPSNYNRFLCRLCSRPHPLRTCRKFLAMNMKERLDAVRTHKYCQNCLAHDHSQGTCLSKHGCRHCNKFHHSLLHINPRLLKDFGISPTRSNSRSRSPSPQPSTSHFARRKAALPTPSTTTLSSLLRQNSTILLPTVLVKIGSTANHARCLLDSGSAVSRISKRMVDKLHLTTLTMEAETMCPIVLKSRFDSECKIEGILRVDNRITSKTPANSLPASFKQHFRDLFLADPKFFESAGIDVIIGVDLYPKVMREGVFTKTGLPTAQSTIFGWTIYGACLT